MAELGNATNGVETIGYRKCVTQDEEYMPMTKKEKDASEIAALMITSILIFPNIVHLAIFGQRKIIVFFFGQKRKIMVD